MNRYSLVLLPVAMAAFAAMATPVVAMSLQDEREQIGRNMEESRRQSGRELNAIRDGYVTDNAEPSGSEAARSATGMPATPRPQPGRTEAERPGELSQDGNESSSTVNAPRRSIMRPQQPSAAQSGGSGDAYGNAAPANRATTGENGTSMGNGLGTVGTGIGGAAAGSSASGQR